MERFIAVLVGCVVALVLAPAAASAQPDFVPGEVVVKFKDDATAQQRAAASRAAGILERVAPVRGVGARLVEVTGNVRAAVRALERSPAVEYAEPNYIYRALATPNDPRFNELWGLHNTGQGGGTADADIDAPEGWDLLGLGSFPSAGGAKVGIVDTGIRRSHPEFAGRVVDCGGVNNFGISLLILILFSDPTIVDGKCEDDNGHGTHVAGTIAANANNGTGVAGVAFNSPLAICKGLNGQGSGTLVMIANCITWLADRDADVISMSLGGSAGSQALQDAVRNASEAGSLLVAAAGNSGNSSLSYPAAYPEVVSVAATDRNDNRASFSQFNADVEVAAPGVDILSTWNDGGYRVASGTSMATPHAAAVAALIAGANPSGGPDEWRAALQAATDDLGAPGRDPQFGFGRVTLSKVSP
ncbi:MAG TPA: S8 family serine peptidase [Solirubrobacterales bacterium]|jgi:thermitase